MCDSVARACHRCIVVCVGASLWLHRCSSRRPPHTSFGCRLGNFDPVNVYVADYNSFKIKVFSLPAVNAPPPSPPPPSPPSPPPRPQLPPYSQVAHLIYSGYSYVAASGDTFRVNTVVTSSNDSYSGGVRFSGQVVRDAALDSINWAEGLHSRIANGTARAQTRTAFLLASAVTPIHTNYTLAHALTPLLLRIRSSRGRDQASLGTRRRL